jgi:hypothetical protein
MNDNQREFFKELADLMEKHKVELECIERGGPYGWYADGICFSFEEPYEEINIDSKFISANQILEVTEK